MVCGTVVDANPGGDPAGCLTEHDPTCHAIGGNGSWIVGISGVRQDTPSHLVASIEHVPVKTLNRPLRRNTPTDLDEAGEFLSLFDVVFDRFNPDVVMTYGGDPLTLEILSRARRRGATTVFTLHNLNYSTAAHFADVDAILVPSRFSADYYRRFLGINCVALASLVNPSRVRTELFQPIYLTFINPSFEKGVYVFVRLTDELARCRPDIPLLVVESRGAEAHLVDCGIDLRPHGNVFLMAQTPDPRDFWSVTRVCLMPSLCMESQGLVAVEAMVNGIPVVASDRGALPETLGGSGVVLPLPDRLTPFTRELPTAEEVAPWVEAIIALWDDPVWYAEQSRRAAAESVRWSTEVLGPQYTHLFENVRPLA